MVEARNQKQLEGWDYVKNLVFYVKMKLVTPILVVGTFWVLGTLPRTGVPQNFKYYLDFLLSRLPEIHAP